MTAHGHTKGAIDRDMLLQVMGGTQSFKRDLKRHVPYWGGQTIEEYSPAGRSARKATCAKGHLHAGQPSF
eukprot:367951-Pyramimonas_sp.AAC.1